VAITNRTVGIRGIAHGNSKLKKWRDDSFGIVAPFTAIKFNGGSSWIGQICPQVRQVTVSGGWVGVVTLPAKDPDVMQEIRLPERSSSTRSRNVSYKGDML
jgi:hypothetical protein